MFWTTYSLLLWTPGHSHQSAHVTKAWRGAAEKTKHPNWRQGAVSFFAWNCIKNSCHPTYLWFQLKTQTGASACYIGPWLVHTDLSHLLGSLPKSYLTAGSLYLFTIGLSNVRVDSAQDQSNRLGIRLRLLWYSKKLSQRILLFSPPMSTKSHPFPYCVCKHQTGKEWEIWESDSGTWVGEESTAVSVLWWCTVTAVLGTKES